MRKELQIKLFKKYPKIFRQKDLPETESCMCWGIMTADGWYWLIDNLCDCIQWHVDHNNAPQIEAVQLKEKFSKLRFYYEGGDELIHGMVWFAEHLSGMICEECGITDDVSRNTEGYIRTLCSKCRKKMAKERNKPFSIRRLCERMWAPILERRKNKQ